MLQRETAPSGVVYYVSPVLQAVGVPHAFSTRLGGVSPRPFDSLNLGNPDVSQPQDDRVRIFENYGRLEGAAGLTGRERCWVHQAHGARVVLVERGRAHDGSAKADALVTDDATRILSVRTADCVPILLATDDGRRVAAVHAGWRGVLAGVVVEAVKQTRRSDNPRLRAAIGPSIGLDAFEVGPDVVNDFERMFGARAPVKRKPDGKGHVDLKEALRLQLLNAGLKPEDIDTTDRCSFRDASEFFSHRREQGVTGRMAALIGCVGERGAD